MLKILATGGAGYIGSILLPFLLGEGFKASVYDSLYPRDIVYFFYFE